jgi:hypothetical protein
MCHISELGSLRKDSLVMLSWALLTTAYLIFEISNISESNSTSNHFLTMASSIILLLVRNYNKMSNMGEQHSYENYPFVMGSLMRSLDQTTSFEVCNKYLNWVLISAILWPGVIADHITTSQCWFEISIIPELNPDWNNSFAMRPIVMLLPMKFWVEMSIILEQNSTWNNSLAMQSLILAPPINFWAKISSTLEHNRTECRPLTVRSFIMLSIASIEGYVSA